jgi:hypothetical protein
MESAATLSASLTDIATHFVILPGILADALDEHGPDAKAWAWLDGGKLLKLEVQS